MGTWVGTLSCGTSGEGGGGEGQADCGQRASFGMSVLCAWLPPADRAALSGSHFALPLPQPPHPKIKNWGISQSASLRSKNRCRFSEVQMLLFLLISWSTGSKFLIGAFFLIWGKARACLRKRTSSSTLPGNRIRARGFWLRLLLGPSLPAAPRAPAPRVSSAPPATACGMFSSGLASPAGVSSRGRCRIWSGFGSLAPADFRGAPLLAASTRRGRPFQAPRLPPSWGDLSRCSPGFSGG